ncbi:MAG: S41 family peptidase [Ruminococcus sp.]|nr:S41 family peptidase [Ruminococcus sp.]
MKLWDIIRICACIASCGVLWWAAGRSEKVRSPKWRRLWLLAPLLALPIDKLGPDRALLPLYIGAVAAFCGFFAQKRQAKRALAAAGALCMAASFPSCLLDPRYRAKDYLGDFETGFACMREHYVLTEHKGIDWDALYDEYQPIFADIDERQDVGANAIAWGKFCGEFHDGHVGYVYKKEDVGTVNEALKKALGNDYGLAVMHCTDGSFAAVNVDESLAAYGIHNGTVITAWDGKAPDEVSKSSPLYDCNIFSYNEGTEEADFEIGSFPDIDNEIFWSSIFAAGIGGDTVEVTFIADDGSEQVAQLPKTGGYMERFSDTLKKLKKGVNIGNLRWKKVSDTAACLRIKGMSFDSKSYSSVDDDAYDEMKDEIRETILSYQSEGVKDVIIDLRSNGGGSPHMVNSVLSMFAPKGEHYCLTNAVWDKENACWAQDADGNYLRGDDITYQGEQLLGDGRVIIIVNSQSVSAADMMTKEAESLDNMTVIGFTGPNGSSQAVGMKSAQNGSISFSNCIVLDKDGSIMIDSGTDRQSSDGDGVQIVPFDSEAISALFDSGEDYLLDRALEMLK